MKNIKVPRVSIEEAPTIAAALNQRVKQIGITHTDLLKQADIASCTLGRILSGKESYKRPTLEKLTDVLDDMEKHGIHFVTPHEKREGKQRQREIKKERKLERYAQIKNWGAKIKARREDTGLSLKVLGDIVGITPQRMQQIEAGNFSPERSSIKRVLEALGYPRMEIDTLDNDTPQLPEWVESRNREAAAELLRQQEASAAKSQSRKDIGPALQTLRQAKGITQRKLGDKTAYVQEVIAHIENAESYSDEALKKVLAEFHLKDADQLIEYVATSGIERPEMAKIRDHLEPLYVASRILRTHWNMSAEELSNFYPPTYKTTKISILALESPAHPYGIECNPAFEMVIGLIAALYNADQKQERKYQMLDACPNLRSIAGMANRGKLPVYGKHFRQLLERAIDDIVDTALEIEKQVYERVPKAGYKTGLCHLKNTQIHSLKGMLSARPERPGR